MLANCAIMSKRKGAFNPEEFFFKALLKRNSLGLFFSIGCVGVAGCVCAMGWAGAASFEVDGYCASLVVWSYFLKYVFPERVPVGGASVGCATRTIYSSSESVRELVGILASSFNAKEIMLHDFPLCLGRGDSHCSSLTMSG